MLQAQRCKGKGGTECCHARGEEERAEVNGVSPWSAGGKVSLLCFSESERFPCPDRSALRETQRDREVVVS